MSRLAAQFPYTRRAETLLERCRRLRSELAAVREGGERRTGAVAANENEPETKEAWWLAW